MKEREYVDGYHKEPKGVRYLAMEPAMLQQLETLMTKLDDSLQQLSDDDIHAVLAMVPWARESIHTYLSNHRAEMETEVLNRIEELLIAAE
jgi:hypothetical protein